MNLDDPALYEGVDDERDRAARRELLRWLDEAGMGEGEVRAAIAEGRLATLPIESALSPGEPRYTLTHVARAVGIDPTFLRRVLLALGRANPRPRERYFTDSDVEIARRLRAFVELGLPRDGIVQVARVLSMSLATLSSAAREIAAEALIRPGDSESELALRYARAASGLLPLVGPMLEEQFVQHLRDGLEQDVLTRSDRGGGGLEALRPVAVGFADLVGFTRVGERVPPDELGRLGGILADTASEVARPPVSLVKTIGDAAMFVSPEVEPLLDALVELMRRFGEAEEDLPRLRAGVAFGPALTRAGDWFGPAVNLASRITGVSRPNRIYVDAAAREAVTDERFTWAAWSRRLKLKGIRGLTKVHRLRGDRDEPDEE